MCGVFLSGCIAAGRASSGRSFGGILGGVTGAGLLAVGGRHAAAVASWLYIPHAGAGALVRAVIPLFDTALAFFCHAMAGAADADRKDFLVHMLLRGIMGVCRGLL